MNAFRDAGTLDHVAARWPELQGDARLALLHAAAGLEAPTAALLAAAKEALHDADDRVRLESIDLLSKAGDDAVEPLLDHALRGGQAPETERAVRALADLATPKAAEAGLRALGALPARRQERYRAAFLATLGR